MIKKIQDANVKNKTVVLRLDLNIPYSNGQSSDISRIERSKKTILYLTQNNNKVVIVKSNAFLMLRIKTPLIE